MTEVKTGDTVRIHYTGTLLDGTEFDSSEGHDPLEFTVGSGQIIKGLDVALPGMIVGQKKTVNIACVDAYGPLQPDLRQDVPRNAVPEDIELSLGAQLQMEMPDGQAITVTVTGLNDTTVTLDANHRLAGQDLIFDIELMSVNG